MASKSKKPAPPAADPSTVVSVDIPVAPVDEAAHMAQHIEIQFLSYSQRRALRSVYNATRDAKHLENGRAVRNNADAIRYILERIARKG